MNTIESIAEIQLQDGITGKRTAVLQIASRSMNGCFSAVLYTDAQLMRMKQFSYLDTS
jgi:hypothetical protein